MVHQARCSGGGGGGGGGRRRCTFVDLGSGTGRSLALAAVMPGSSPGRT